MGGIFSSSGKIDHSKTQARKVVAAFLVPENSKNSEKMAGDHCNSVKMRIKGKEGTINKPQWVMARPYFALDSNNPDYGVLESWYREIPKDQRTLAESKKPSMLHGPPDSLRRWSKATAIRGADMSGYLHSMSNNFDNSTVTLTPTGRLLDGRFPPGVTPDMLWPTDKTVYDIPKKQFETAIEWNIDYSVKDPPFAKAGRAVLQHGSVILEPKDSDASFSTDKFKKSLRRPRKIVSIATLVPPEPFVKAMQGEDSSSQDDNTDETRRQTLARQKKYKRWIVVVGGAHQVDNQGKSASPWFSEVAFEIGKALADQWPTLKKEFSGIVTSSGAGFCDTVTWDEEVSRGFCEVHKGAAPIYHIKDVNQVMLEGLCCDIPFGHGVILDSPGWKDDWKGNNRDLILSILAQDGLVVYGGIPARPHDKEEPFFMTMESAMYRYSLLPPRPPLMSVVVAGASKSGENIRIDSNTVGEFMQKLDIPSDAVFSSIRKMVDKYDSFFSRENRSNNSKRVKEKIPKDSGYVRYNNQGRAEDTGSLDNADVFYEPGDENIRDEVDYNPGYDTREFNGLRRSRSSYFGGGNMYAKEMAARLPIIYMTTTEGVKRKRVMIDESRGYTGFTRLDIQRDGAQETEENRRENVRVYCTNLIADVSKRISARRLRNNARSGEDENVYEEYGLRRRNTYFDTD